MRLAEMLIVDLAKGMRAVLIFLCASLWLFASIIEAVPTNKKRPHEIVGLSLSSVLPKSSIPKDKRERLIDLIVVDGLPKNEAFKLLEISNQNGRYYMRAYKRMVKALAAKKGIEDFGLDPSEYNEADLTEEKIVHSFEKLRKEASNDMEALYATAKDTGITIDTCLRILNQYRKARKEPIIRSDPVDNFSIKVLELKKEGLENHQIAEKLNGTLNSVGHALRRLKRIQSHETLEANNQLLQEKIKKAKKDEKLTRRPSKKQKVPSRVSGNKRRKSETIETATEETIKTVSSDKSKESAQTTSSLEDGNNLIGPPSIEASFDACGIPSHVVSSEASNCEIESLEHAVFLKSIGEWPYPPEEDLPILIHKDELLRAQRQADAMPPSAIRPNTPFGDKRPETPAVPIDFPSDSMELEDPKDLDSWVHFLAAIP